MGDYLNAFHFQRFDDRKLQDWFRSLLYRKRGGIFDNGIFIVIILPTNYSGGGLSNVNKG